MKYPQDPKSRYLLNASKDQVGTWGLVVVVENQVVELQAWNDTEKVKSFPGPSGRLIDFETSEHRLILYLRKSVFEWNISTGATAPKKYKNKKNPKGEYKFPQNIYHTTPGEPQFRGRKNWCAVIIDGDVKVCHPKEIFQKSQEKWQSLPLSERSALLSEASVKKAGILGLTGMKLFAVASLISGFLYGSARLLLAFGIL